MALRLRQYEIYPTTQRLSVAGVLLARHQHMTAEELHEQLDQAGKPVSKATVYNVSKLFVDKGLVQEIVIDGGRTYFDSNAGYHAHFYNIDTGELIDFQMPEGAELRDFQLPPGTRIESVGLVVRISSKPE